MFYCIECYYKYVYVQYIFKKLVHGLRILYIDKRDFYAKVNSVKIKIPIFSVNSIAMNSLLVNSVVMKNAS